MFETYSLPFEAGSAIHRFEVPVDGEWHTIRLTGGPIFVACREIHVVEFWARSADPKFSVDRIFRVFGTGHAITNPARYVGTAIAPGGRLVWHLMERS